MKKLSFLLGFVLFGSLSSLVCSADLAGVPMKHQMVQQMQCATCHGNQGQFAKPQTEKCVACHGLMDKIATKINPMNKQPHQSAHYGDTVDCVVCHAEHKPSKDLCSTCHKVQWNNFR